MKNKPPVGQGRIPLFFNVHERQVDRFLSSLVIRKLYFGFYVLPDAPVHIFDRIGGINDFPDLHGKIKITGQIIPVGHGLLDGKVVESTHEKLISQEIFLKVNGIHQANPNYGVPHKTENDYLPLKVFVKCDQCGHPFTGYTRTKITKKEKKELVFYYYKCRTNGCKCNRNNKELHQLFQEFLGRYSVKQELVSTLQYELEHLFYELNRDNAEQEVPLKGQLTEVKKKLSTILENYHVLETITQEVFDNFY